jgi:hypothetical protein
MLLPQVKKKKRPIEEKRPTVIDKRDLLDTQGRALLMLLPQVKKKKRPIEEKETYSH